MKNSFIFTFLFFSIFSFGIEVEIKDNKMIVDGKPFYMKGICYHPVKIGRTKRSFESLTEDLILIKEAGINTLEFMSLLMILKCLMSFKLQELKL